jgi:hypothetical protein
MLLQRARVDFTPSLPRSLFTALGLGLNITRTSRINCSWGEVGVYRCDDSSRAGFLLKMTAAASWCQLVLPCSWRYVYVTWWHQANLNNMRHGNFLRAFGAGHSKHWMSPKHVNVSEGVRLLSGLRSVSRRVHSVSCIVQTLLPKALVKFMYQYGLKSSVTVPFTC